MPAPRCNAAEAASNCWGLQRGARGNVFSPGDFRWRKYQHLARHRNSGCFSQRDSLLASKLAGYTLRNLRCSLAERCSEERRLHDHTTLHVAALVDPSGFILRSRNESDVLLYRTTDWFGFSLQETGVLGLKISSPPLPGG